MSKNNDFFELYKHPEWQRKRLEVMEDRDFTCEHCGSKEKTLNVHHTYYKRGAKPWEYDNKELLCLCKGCHDIFHKLKDRLNVLMGKVGFHLIEQVIGYVEGILYVNDSGPWKSDQITVDSSEIAYGLTDASLRIENRVRNRFADLIIEAAMESENGSFDPERLEEINEVIATVYLGATTNG